MGQRDSARERRREETGANGTDKKDKAGGERGVAAGMKGAGETVEPRSFSGVESSAPAAARRRCAAFRRCGSRTDGPSGGGRRSWRCRP